MRGARVPAVGRPPTRQRPCSSRHEHRPQNRASNSCTSPQGTQEKAGHSVHMRKHFLHESLAFPVLMPDFLILTSFPFHSPYLRNPLFSFLLSLSDGVLAAPFRRRRALRLPSRCRRTLASCRRPVFSSGGRYSGQRHGGQVSGRGRVYGWQRARSSSHESFVASLVWSEP